MPTAVLNAKKIATVVERKEILHIPHGMLRCDKNVINLLNLIDYRCVKERNIYTEKRLLRTEASHALCDYHCHGMPWLDTK